MAKGFRPTGRRKKFTRRFSKGRFNSAVTTKTRAWQSSFTRYLPVPAQMKVAVKLTLSSTEDILAGGSITFVQNTLEPYANWQAAVWHAEYFRQLMRIYSRSIVSKVTVETQIQNFLDAPLESAEVFSNASAVAALVALGPQERTDQITSYPESRTAYISARNGGPMTRMFLTCDNHKLLGQGNDRDLFVTAPYAGGAALVAPPIVGSIANPQHLLSVFNRGAAPSTVLVRRVFTFSVDFSDRFAQSQLLVA